MSYLVPSEFVTKMVDAGESKIFMSTRDTVIRAYMAGAILALAAWFAVTITVNTGHAKFSIADYFIWNEIPTLLGNLVGGISFTGLTLYATHVRTAPKREIRTAQICAAV
jgi:formate/nitrite transporter FocA (FNT family)